MATTMRPAAWMGVGLALGVVLTSGWAQAQGDEARMRALQQALQEAQRNPTRVLTGADIGFRLQGVEGDTPVVVPVIRRNGDWVEVAFGGGGIRKLTK